MSKFIPEKDSDIDYIKKILIKYYGLERFVFTRKLTFFGYSYKISFKPYGYYFTYYKKKKLLLHKNYFPRWVEPDFEKRNKLFEYELNLWLKSIKKIFLRKNIINTSIVDGAEKRKGFAEKSKEI
tara:strand:+ start:183 stop:557 length:375 start_codon:yes stop_codon:yes gene_type:complete